MKRQYRLGVDVVDIEDFAMTMQRNGNSFVETVFTPNEVAYCNERRLQHYAARWAAKEAFVKAAAPEEDFRFNWNDIEVINDIHGAPALRLYGSAQQWADKVGVDCFTISLSHSKRTAMAVVLISYPDMRTENEI
jgi:holo-[acyl-carrier protein] synthase